MKRRVLTIIALLFLSVRIFADGIPGIFGIDFGASPSEVKKAMTKKGWTLFKADDSSLLFKKNGGTFANYRAEGVGFNFFDDKFYNVTVMLEPATDLSSFEEFLNSVTNEIIMPIKDLYDLTYDDMDEEPDDDGYISYTLRFSDPHNNIFSLCAVPSEAGVFTFISMLNYELAEKKVMADRMSKYKDISSDL